MSSDVVSWQQGDPFCSLECLIFQLWLFVHEERCSHLTLAAGHKHCLIAAATVVEEPGAAATCAELPAPAMGAGQPPDRMAAPCSATVRS